MLRSLCALFSCASLAFFAAGCWNSIDSAQQAKPKSSLIPYGAAFQNAFTDCTWISGSGPNGEKTVQFEGKISGSLHSAAAGVLHNVAERTVFSAACTYLGALQKAGKVQGDPLLTFDTAVYPIGADGTAGYDAVGAYLDNPENRSAVLSLDNFYRKRFWEEGSTVTVTFAVDGVKEARVTKVSNLHWDYDPQFANNPETVLKVVYDYVKPIIVVQ